MSKSRIWQRTFFSFGKKSSTGSANKKPIDRVKVSVDKTTGIARVSLARPEKLNALDLPMFEAINQVAKDLSQRTDIRVVLLSGEGRAFSSGLDVKSIIKAGSPNRSIEKLLSKDGDERISNLAQDVAYRWREVPVPVIAILHGMCFGGGLQIALGADIRFATPDCKLSVMEAKWGLIPDMSASVTLRELVRIDVAKELTFTGKIITGSEAADLGLVTRVHEDPFEEALKTANEIVKRSPDSVQFSKKLYQENWVAAEKDSLALEENLQRKLLASWNQLAASGRNFGIRFPYFLRKQR